MNALVNLFFKIRRKILLNIVSKPIIKTAVVVSGLFSKKTAPIGTDTSVFMATCKDDFYIGLTAIMSFNFFLPNLQYVLIDDGSITKLQKFILSRLPFKCKLSGIDDTSSIIRKLEDCPHLLRFFNYGWSGKKFLIPLLQSKYKKIIILDSDTLFFSFPKEISNWIHKDNIKQLYLNDYDDFQVISPIEARYILKKSSKISHFNVGLLCINLKQFFKSNNLEMIESYTKSIVKIAKSRKDHDHWNKDDLIYVFPLIEQTLFWLTFELCKTMTLKNKYYVFPEHRYRQKNISNPIAIHFTGEPDNFYLYKYLIHSLIQKITDLFNRQLFTNLPWYIYLNLYCINCDHVNKTLVLKK